MPPLPPPPLELEFALLAVEPELEARQPVMPPSPLDAPLLLLDISLGVEPATGSHAPIATVTTAMASNKLQWKKMRFIMRPDCVRPVWQGCNR
jgi:hypothetical protein